MTTKETEAKDAHAKRVAAERKWRFKATARQDIVIDGHLIYKKGQVLRPKGIYYNGHRDKWIVLVGDILSGHTSRQKVPRGSMEIKIWFGEDDDG